MANSLLPAQKNEGHEYKWIHIDDFSPGIYDPSFISGSDPVVSAPIGAADARLTYACAAIQGGALGPLPARTQAFSYPVAFPGAVTKLYELGFAANLGLNDGTTELIVMLEGDDGTNHYYLVYSVIAETGAANVILSTTNPTTGAGFFGASFPSWTRMSTQPIEGNTGFILPTPVLIWPASVPTDANGSRGHIYAYPDPANPTAFGAKDLVSATPANSGIAGPLLGYADRIVVFQGEGASWPSGTGINTDENIGITDPPEGYTYPATFGANIPNTTVLSAENPWGYGAWGSESVGELILIKKNGGAVIVNGDILSPSSVIPLPAVQSTNADGSGLAAATDVGLVYCSKNHGAWVWNGGNTAQKISQQLDDNFFNAGATGGTDPNDNLLFLVERWQDWILFSNNYMYNPQTKSWWILYPNQSQTSPGLQPITFFWWKQGRKGNIMYAAPIVLNKPPPASSSLYYNVFDSTVPTQHYQWGSLPIHVVPTADRVVDVRHVYIRLSQPDGSTTSTCTVTVNGVNVGSTSGAITSDPQVFRFNVGIQTKDIRIQLNCDNTVPGQSPPLVHSVDVEYRVRQSEASSN